MNKLLRKTGILLFLTAFGLSALKAVAVAPSEPDWFRKAFPEKFAEEQRKNAAKAASRVNIQYEGHRYASLVVCVGENCLVKADHTRYGAGTAMRYSWWDVDGGTPFIEDQTTPDYNLYYAKEGRYGLCVVVTDQGNEIGRDTVDVYVGTRPVAATYTVIPDTVCYGMEATIGTEGQGRHWAWSTGGTTQYINIRPSKTTYYPFRLSDYPIVEMGYKNLCYAEDSSWVKVFDSAQFSVIGPDGICEGSTIELRVEGGTEILWNGQAGSHVNRFPVYHDTVMQVTATDRYNCRGKQSKKIGMIASPDGELRVYVDDEPGESVCLGKKVRIEVLSDMADHFRWFTRDTTTYIELMPKTDFRAYCDLSVGASGDCKTRIETDIKVENCNRVYFASGFVLDGFSKTFGPIGVEDTARQYYFAVFSRNGEMVYSTHEFSQGWDGRFKGQWVLPGVYAYIFKETYDQFEWTYRGTVSVIR